ncbi:MAG: acetyl ornithine aminotransferase family protein [Terriglobales bacterium]
MIATSTPSRFTPQILTPLPGPNARRVLAGDAALISPSYTRSYPLVAKRGRGMVIEDVDGNQFLDFSAGIAVCSTGHCHPQVSAAIERQARELIHMSGTDFYYPQMVEVAETLSRLAPMPGPHRVYYGNSGAEAMEAAMKLARYHTRRQSFIAFYNCFHGRTFGALSLTSSKTSQRERFAPLVPGVFHIPYPDEYHPLHGATDVAAACLEDLDRLFRTTTPPNEVAAIVLEPVQGEGGYIVPPSAFVREIRRICDRHGILLIADEVQSGCGRTGKMWAIEHHGVAPDILTVAKGVASGMPLGVTLARAGIMDWAPGAHASTFGGNPVCLAAAQATLQLLESTLIRNAAEVGDYLKGKMQTWPERFPIVGQVRGLGLMLAFELVSERQHRTRDAAARDRLVQAAFEKGLLVLGCGPNSIRLMPPLICTPADVDVAVEILEACLAAESGRA